MSSEETSQENRREPMALDESGHGDLLQDAWEVSQKMLKELDIKVGEVGSSWIKTKILSVLSENERLELADLFSEIRGIDQLEGVADLDITRVLDELINSGKVMVEDESGTYYFKTSPRSDDERMELQYLLKKNITIFGAPQEEE